jgi:hypothetical protein
VSKDVERETRRFEVCQRNVACRLLWKGELQYMCGYTKQLKGYGKEHMQGFKMYSRVYATLLCL